MACAKTDQTIGGIEQHCKNHDGGKCVCNVCKKTFVYQSNLNVHSKVHGVEKYWKCLSKPVSGNLNLVVIIIVI